LSRTDEPDLEYLTPELNYISSYAIHRGKQIEQDIWSVSGVVQLFDITQEALIRSRVIPKIAEEVFSDMEEEEAGDIEGENEE